VYKTSFLRGGTILYHYRIFVRTINWQDDGSLALVWRVTTDRQGLGYFAYGGDVRLVASAGRLGPCRLDLLLGNMNDEV
jgi:hypothetical protein